MKVLMLASITILLLFTSCDKHIDKDQSNHFYYNWNKTKVIFKDHRNWNYTREVNCDLESFRIIKGMWAKDKNYIFYEEVRKKNIDVGTFYFDDKGLPKDSSKVFTTQWSGYDAEIMSVWKGADPKTFELLDSIKNYDLIQWGKDHENYFYMLEPYECDYPTFKVLSSSYSKDKNNVYYNASAFNLKIVEGADPETFEFDKVKKVFKDKNHEYFNGERK